MQARIFGEDVSSKTYGGNVLNNSKRINFLKEWFDTDNCLKATSKQLFSLMELGAIIVLSPSQWETGPCGICDDDIMWHHVTRQCPKFGFCIEFIWFAFLLQRTICSKFEFWI